MSLRKVAALLAAFGLLAAMFQAGVAAQFLRTVTATENISVGNFDCRIVDPSDGVINADGTNVTYDAGKIVSSAPGSAPFKFSVKDTGDMAMLITVAKTVTQSQPSGPFYAMDLYPQVVNPGESWTYQGAIAWTALGMADLNQTASVTYTVNCTDVADLTTFGPAPMTGSGTGPYTVSSTDKTWSIYGLTPDWGGVGVPGQSGKKLTDLHLSFSDAGSFIGAGSPRWSIPISENGTTWSGVYAFIGGNTCSSAVVGTVATCHVDYASVPSTDWVTFANAHPTWTVAPGFVPLIVADSYNGAYVIGNIQY